MSFETNIPRHLKEVNQKIALKYAELDKINWGHECNCTHCTLDGDDPDPEAEQKSDAINEEIETFKKTKERLIAHASWHNIEVIGDNIYKNPELLK